MPLPGVESAAQARCGEEADALGRRERARMDSWMGGAWNAAGSAPGRLGLHEAHIREPRGKKAFGETVMYIGTFEGLGLGDVKFRPQYSGRDYMWSDPVKTTRFVAKAPFIGGNQVERTLKVRFSEDWPTFRARFKKALGRFLVFRSDKGRIAESHLEGMALQALHDSLVADKSNAKAFVVLKIRVFFLKRPSGDWFLNNFALPDTWRWE